MFRIAYAACMSPLDCQPIMNVFDLNPVAMIFSGDYVYNDSRAEYTHNGYNIIPTIFWDFVASPTGAPYNAHSLQYCYDRFDKHYGRNGIRPFREFWAERERRKTLVFMQGDDHDCAYNNQDHSLALFKTGFPLGSGPGSNASYGQVIDDATFTQAQNLQVWRIGQSAMRKIEKDYSNNPPRGAPNGDVPKEMVGVATAADYDQRYFEFDFGPSGEPGGRTLRVLFTDSISYKNKASDTDDLTKAFWGAAQEKWIIDRCRDAKKKGFGAVVISSTKDLWNLDNNDGPYVYSATRDRLLKQIHDEDLPVAGWMTGDKHVPHAGMVSVANGDAFDATSICACPFGQGIGGLKQYNQNTWASLRNDGCVIGMIEVDAGARTTTMSILDAFSLAPLFSAVVPFGKRVPSSTSGVTTSVLPAISPLPSRDRVASAGMTAPSPATYQNIGKIPELIVIKGGTVSKIERSVDGTTYDDSGFTSGEFLLGPGHFLKVTFTVLPTLQSKHPMPFSIVGS